MITARMSEVTIRQEGQRVVVISNGKAILDLPWDAAQALARALHIKAHAAEEEAKALDIIYDQAILTRLGVPFGLTNRPDLLKEAANEAAWNPDLRRYIKGKRAGGIESRAIFGTPSILQKEPTCTNK